MAKTGSWITTVDSNDYETHNRHTLGKTFQGAPKDILCLCYQFKVFSQWLGLYVTTSKEKELQKSLYLWIIRDEKIIQKDSWTGKDVFEKVERVTKHYKEVNNEKQNP